MRSSAMRLLDRNLAALRLAVSIGTIVIALGAAGSAFAGHGAVATAAVVAVTVAAVAGAAVAAMAGAAAE